MNISDFNKDQKPNFAGFEVIGAGLPRTGTNSLRTALNFLLDGAVYHMFQVAFGEKVDANFWEKALKIGVYLFSAICENVGKSLQNAP